MKKNFLLTVVVALFSFLTATAQDDNTYNVVINLSNGSTITLGANDVKDIVFSDGELVVTGETITSLVDQIKEIDGTLKATNKTIELLDGQVTKNKENTEGNTERIELLEGAVEKLQATIEELQQGGEKKNLPEFVDLGLSVKWASYNIGATKPEEIGGYYAWGEIETKEDYSAETYKFYDEDLEEVNMPGTYNSSTFGYYIGGDPELDVVTATYGEGYRMPTQAEAQELVDNCEIEWVEENGQRCAKVTGPNGNFILLPAGSYMQGTSLRAGTFLERCYYWTADSDGEEEDQSFQLMIYNTTKTVSHNRVRGGANVRGVQP